MLNSECCNTVFLWRELQVLFGKRMKRFGKGLNVQNKKQICTSAKLPRRETFPKSDVPLQSNTTMNYLSQRGEQERISEELNAIKADKIIDNAGQAAILSLLNKDKNTVVSLFKLW